VEKESRIEFLRRQRLAQGEKNIRKITRHAAVQLDENPGGHSIQLMKLFKKKTEKPASAERPFPISANDEKTQNKKVRKIRIGWRFFSAILTILFSTCLLVGWRSGDFRVGQIEITGNERISAEDINIAFNENEKPIFSVIPAEIADKVGHAFPEFKDIRVNANLPNKISIGLTERAPILAWKIADILLWVDGEGIIMPARGQYEGLLTIESSSQPIFSYPKAKDETDPEIEKSQEKQNYWKQPPYSMIWYEYHRFMESGLLNAIVHLNSQIPAERTYLFDIHRGLGWNDTHGWKIFIGFDLSQIQEKILAYEKIVSELTSQGIHPSLVSVEYLHAPYYRLD
jgi:cell division protein FtsQ